ncbi:LOW QUALITY PROTEIN: kinesin-like protein KIF16B [Podargus strigoides]
MRHPFEQKSHSSWHAISPADVNYGETSSILHSANRAQNIINKPTINEDPKVLIREQRAEIATKPCLPAQGNQITHLDSPTALSMEEKLQQNEARVQELTKEWTNKWNRTQRILKEQTLALRKEEIGVVDSELPHLIGIDDDVLSTGIILYHLRREEKGVILLGRTSMFCFNHPREAAKLREKSKSGLLSSFNFSMTDLSKLCENLSAVRIFKMQLEFGRQEELEKLESKRKQIEKMEENQRSDKTELVRMQEVESQCKETEIVQLQTGKQEESLKWRSVHIESRLKDLPAEKEKFEEVRLREQQEIELQKKKQQEEFLPDSEELQLQELNNEKAEKMQIFREVEKLRKEKYEQYIKLESEKKKLEEQEREQVTHLEEKLGEKQVMIELLKTGDVKRVGEKEQKLATLTSSCSEQAGLQACLEAEQKVLEQDREGINAFIDQEMQRRLQNIHQKAEENDVSLSWSTESLKDDERLNNGTVQCKLKYELQVCSLKQVLDFLTCGLPQICVRMEELKGIYWLAVGKCQKPDPEPACLLLFGSVLYVVVSSVEQDIYQSSLAIFHEFPIITIKEIQVGFAGHNISLLRSAEDGLLTIFAYNKHLTQRICHDIMSVLISTRDDAVCVNQQFFKNSLMQISLDRMSEVNDLEFSNGWVVCHSLGANPDDLKDPIKIIIPHYALCGQGKDEHYEFEMKTTVLDEAWTVFRQYSCFQEMHKTSKLKYPELATSEFPPKKLFGNKGKHEIAEMESLRDFKVTFLNVKTVLNSDALIMVI